LISEISNKKTSNQNDESYSLGGFASYELDLWGRVYSSYKAKDYNFKISQQDYEISKITLASEIVKTFYQIVLYKKKMKIVSRDISLQKKHFDILRLKYQKADANINDKLSSKEKLNSLKAKKLEIKLSLNKLEKQLLVLIGKSPKDKLNISSGEFPRILKTLKNNLPIDLLSKRPDIIKSSLQISVANWNLSSSKSNRFPKISLSGSYNYSSSDYGDLFDNWIKNLAANLTLPIIDAGNKRLEVRKNDSILQEKLYNYKQTVLDSVKEVQNALYDDKIKKQYLDALSDNYNISIEKEKISKLKYQKAYINYLSFLQIQKDTNSSLDSKETAYYELILARINLYKSLAQKIGEYHTND
jgi:outer membrane protein TolC